MLNLYDAFSNIKNQQEFEAFLVDICTPAEIKSITERWQIAQLLYDGNSQRSVSEKLGVSITTVTRVSRFLKNESYKGYQTVLSNIHGHHHA